MRTSRDFHPIDEYIGLRLRRLRKNKHYSLEKPAEWLGISKQQMSRLEQGKSRANVVQLYQLARGFDVPFSWFIEGFVDDKVNLQWQENMLRDSRQQWQATGTQGHTDELLVLWTRLKEDRAKQQIIGLLEVMVDL